MKWFLAFLFCCTMATQAVGQQPALPITKTEVFVDENGQRIRFTLPVRWQLAGSTITNKTGAKVAEFAPGTLANCAHQNGAAYLRELKAGYPDDMDNPRFVGSKTLVLNQTTWTEGIRNVPAWDGKANTGRWYTHDFFAIINKKCFLMTFYSLQPQLQNQADVRRLLASIRLE